ncbi:hypothetical protein HDU83_005727 [Entophlyctis luteolus]|nr:hypothetical protein HDU83_005727 [Entophlyctis luteolus]
MPLWRASQPAPKKVAAPPPAARALARLNDSELLALEHEARKSHKKAVARAVGAASKLAYKAPIAVVSIARAGLAAHQTYIEHADILAEVARRNLTPLEQTRDENLVVLVAGQLVAVAVGHKLGEQVANSFVEPLVAHFGGIALEQMTEKFTEMIVENAAENALSDAVAGDSGGGAGSGRRPLQPRVVFNAVLNKANVKIPGFNVPKGSAISVGKFSVGGPAPASNNNARSNNNPAPPSLPDRALPVPSASPSAPPPITRGVSPLPPPPNAQQSPFASQTSSRPQSASSAAISLAATAITRATTMANSASAALSSAKKQQLVIANEDANSLNVGAKFDHFSGDWLGFGEEIELAIVNVDDEDEETRAIEALAAKSSRTAPLANLAPDTDGRGHKKSVVVLARYRMHFQFSFDSGAGGLFTGRNMVDDLEVNGVVDPTSGFHVDFGEVCPGDSEEEDIRVAYRGRIGGGLLKGEWISSDGRQGLFKMKHM